MKRKTVDEFAGVVLCVRVMCNVREYDFPVHVNDTTLQCWNRSVINFYCSVVQNVEVLERLNGTVLSISIVCTRTRTLRCCLYVNNNLTELESEL